MVFRTCRMTMLSVVTALVLTAAVVGGTAFESRADDVGPKIVGGVPASTADFPWQAQLVIQSRDLCGGELISPVVVLTAAHCLAGVHSAAEVEVSLGRDRSFRGGVIVPASSIYVNPTFDQRELRGDWAFIVLAQPAPAQFTPVQVAGPNERVRCGHPVPPPR